MVVVLNWFGKPQKVRNFIWDRKEELIFEDTPDLEKDAFKIRQQTNFTEWFLGRLKEAVGKSSEKNISEDIMDLLNRQHSERDPNEAAMKDPKKETKKMDSLGISLSESLQEYIFRVPTSVTILGDHGVGKSFLANLLLESTFQDSHGEEKGGRSSPIDSFYLIEESKEPESANSSNLDINVLEYMIPGDYESTINWNGETEARKNTENFYASSQFNAMMNDRYSWAIPQVILIFTI